MSKNEFMGLIKKRITIDSNNRYETRGNENYENQEALLYWKRNNQKNNKDSKSEGMDADIPCQLDTDKRD